MADNLGDTERIPVAAPAIRGDTGVAFPWALIGGCVFVVLGIAGCLIYIFVHLLDQDKILFRIDQNLCTVAVHDAKIDKTLARKGHIKVKIEVPIDCKKLPQD